MRCEQRIYAAYVYFHGNPFILARNIYAINPVKCFLYDAIITFVLYENHSARYLKDFASKIEERFIHKGK